MLGVDIIKISRMESLTDSFIEKVLSVRERQEMSCRPDRIQYMAGRFAGKEAYIKANGIKNRDYRDIEVLDDENGRPHLYIGGIERGHISISHDEYAIAIVIVDKE